MDQSSLIEFMKSIRSNQFVDAIGGTALVAQPARLARRPWYHGASLRARG